jgi:hypothetical protein
VSQIDFLCNQNLESRRQLRSMLIFPFRTRSKARGLSLTRSIIITMNRRTSFLKANHLGVTVTRLLVTPVVGTSSKVTTDVSPVILSG